MLPINPPYYFRVMIYDPVDSLIVAGLTVNASHEDMEEHADFARTPDCSVVFRYFRGTDRVRKAGGSFVAVCRKEFYESSSIHSGRSASEKSNTRFTDGVSSYSDFRAI